VTKRFHCILTSTSAGSDRHIGYGVDHATPSFGAASDGTWSSSSPNRLIEIPGGLRLRGAIDLVERRTDGRLRVTDHKTGKVSAPDGVVVGGGQVLQPVLYALAAAQLLGKTVVEGRLYYCTSVGEYTERVVPLDIQSTAAATAVAEIVGQALRDGFLPAAPAKNACQWCDYKAVCGPYEHMRVERKPVERLAALARLRGMR